MNKHLFKSALALTLGTSLLFGATACSGKKTKMPDKVKLEHVYKAQYLDGAGTEDGVSNFQSFYSIGDTAYLTAYYYEYEDTPDENGDIMMSENGEKLYSMDLETGDTTLLLKLADKYEYTDTTSSYSYHGYITPLGDGTVVYSQTEGKSDWTDPENYINSSSYAIVRSDYDGNVTELIPQEALKNEDGSDGYISNLLFDKKNSQLVIITNTKMMTADLDGNILKTVPCSTDDENGYMSAISMLGSGEIVAMYYDWSNEQQERRVLRRFDNNTGKFEDICELPYNCYQFFAGEDNNIYYNAGSTVYSFDINTQTSTERMNWLNSDLNSSRCNLLGVLDDGRMVCNEYAKDYNSSKLMLLTELADGEAVEKYVLNFASVYLDDNIQDAIISFNKQNEEYRIQFVDYSKYNEAGDYEAGITQLNNDIISGNIPDLFSVQSLPLDTYTSKGLIADLTKYFEKDESFKEEDFFMNVLKAAGNGDKLYSVIPSFTIETLVCKPEFVKDVADPHKLSVSDLIKIRDNNPDKNLFTKTTARGTFYEYTYAQSSLSNFIDNDTGKCHFDSEDFIKYLEFTKGYPEEFNWDEYYANWTEEDDMNEQNQFRTGKTIFNTSYLSTFENAYMKYQFGDDYTYVGFPTLTGKSGISISSSCEVAVSAKTALPDVCWDFVKYLLSESFQNDLTWAFPVRRSSCDKMAQNALGYTEDYSYMGGGGRVYAGTAILAVEDAAVEDIAIAAEEPLDETADDLSEYKVVITQEDIDKIYDVIESADKVAREQKDVLDIINEEAGAFFAGKKSAQEVAGLIQSRVQLYLNESR